MIEKSAANAKAAAKTRPRKTLTLTLDDFDGTCWVPATAADRELMTYVLDGAPYGAAQHSFGKSAYLFLDACARQGVVVTFDPDNSRFQPPSPAPRKSRGPRKGKSPKVPKLPDR